MCRCTEGCSRHSRGEGGASSCWQGGKVGLGRTEVRRAKSLCSIYICIAYMKNKTRRHLYYSQQ